MPDADPVLVERIAANLAVQRERIRRAGGDGVRIIGVTKRQPIEVVRAAVEAGLTDLGENYAQELAAKADEVTSVRWHMIGQVQTNKVRLLAGRVAMVQTVDRPSVVAELAKRIPGCPVLVQVDLAGTPGRGGCTWDDAPGLAESAAAAGLAVEGVMGVAPSADPATVGERFARLRGLRDRLGLVELSIGMSGDLDIAVSEGATMVRIGTAIFGER